MTVIIYYGHFFRIVMIQRLRCVCLQKKILVQKLFHIPPAPLKGRLRFDVVDNIVIVEECDATEAKIGLQMLATQSIKIMLKRTLHLIELLPPNCPLIRTGGYKLTPLFQGIKSSWP